MQELSQLENAMLGAAAGTIEVSIMQPTNYFKNCKQQGVGLSFNPRVMYRGLGANMANMSSVTMAQFWVNGVLKQAMSGSSSGSLNAGQEIAAGFGAGAVSAVLCSPLELVMIQQQRKGGGFGGHAAALARGGVASHLYRGLITTALREGVYTAGYLGVGPVVRKTLRKEYPETWGKTEDIARMWGAIIGGTFACYLSHPLDTIKTCMQGDVERSKFRTIRQTASTLLAEGGITSLYRGATWRCARQICAVFILDKVRVSLSPLMFPSKFEKK